MVELLGFQITRNNDKEKPAEAKQAFTVLLLMTVQQLYLLADTSANTWIWKLLQKMILI